MKILVAVPTYENIYPDTFKSIYELDRGGHEVDFNFFRGYDVAKARNTIGEATVDGGYDFVLMVDSDEVMQKDALLNLLEGQEQEKSMAVGYCLSRPTGAVNTTGRTTVFRWGGKDFVYEDAYTAQELQAIRERGLYKMQIRASGLGCALIHRSVFEIMSFPWFKWIEYENKTQLSEDLHFCCKFAELGKPIFVDTRVSCGHMMRHLAWP